MSKIRSVILILVFSAMFTTGCWDRVELTDRAFDMATGIDELDNGLLCESAQLAIPSKLGTGGAGDASGSQSFFVVEGQGRTIQEAMDEMQAQTSRMLFPGHRRAIYIGENLARHGLVPVLDEFSRNPSVRLRTDVFVVKGEEARQLLREGYPFERLPALASVKIHDQFGATDGDQTFVRFLMDNATDSNCATLPMLDGYKFAGRAIFNRNLQMVGQLDETEASDRFWMLNGLTHKRVTTHTPKGNGYVTIFLTKLHSKLVPTVQGRKVKVNVILTGAGAIVDNSSKLDVVNSDELSLIQKTLEETQSEQVLKMVKRVQRDYGTDIFHFGETIHRRLPGQWKTLKPNWEKAFPTADVTVTVHLKISQSGLTGRPLQVREVNTSS